MATYMEKATREAKPHTSWINSDSEYDAAVRALRCRPGRPSEKPVFGRIPPLSPTDVGWGLYSALSQTLLETYLARGARPLSGAGSWDFSLVDPDNRRPVDFAGHAKMLARLQGEVGRQDPGLLRCPVGRRTRANPRKLLVTSRLLQFRRRPADLFRFGDYIPLEVVGSRASISVPSRGGCRPLGRERSWLWSWRRGCWRS